jgi:hypothetical protein
MSANDPSDSKSEGSKGRLDYDVSMRRLFYLALVGCGIILLDAVGTRPGFLRTLSVGLMTAGAAMFVGGLLGFLFGVPYTREGEQPAGTKDGQGGQQKSGSDALPTSYRPNTSLEQISDWLTKILVGVGLVQINDSGQTKGVGGLHCAGSWGRPSERICGDGPDLFFGLRICLWLSLGPYLPAALVQGGGSG